MKTKSLKVLSNRLYKAKNAYNDAIADLEKAIQEKSDMKIFIQDHAGDGLCVIDEEPLYGNIPTGMQLSSALEIIKEDGRLTQENFIHIY